jgi:hypothetical protein
MPHFLHAVCCLVLLQQLPASEPEFLCTSDVNSRFVAVERVGDGVKRHASVVVLEFIPEQGILKQLYEVDLVNKRMPFTRSLSTDGRFLVTTDEFSALGTGPATVVIYDLARREHSAYSGCDFLEKRIIDKLDSSDEFPGFKWTANNCAFNKDATEFFPTLPKNCEGRGLPCVVVNLPSRTIRVVKPEDLPSKEIVYSPYAVLHWLPSQTKHTVGDRALPTHVTRRAPNSPDQLFEIVPGKIEYKRSVP